MTKPKSELESFIEEHGGIVVCGDTPRGPIYSLGGRTARPKTAHGGQVRVREQAREPRSSPTGRWPCGSEEIDEAAGF